MTVATAAFAAYLVVVLATGQAVVAASVRDRRLPAALHLAATLMAGMVVVALAVTARGLTGAAAQRWLPVALAVAGIAAGTVLWRRGWGRPLPPRRLRGREWWCVAPLVPVVGAALLVTLDALQTPMLGWDAFAIWDFRAKALLSGGLLDGAAFVDPNLAFCHPEYPLLVPAQYATVHNLAGAPCPLGAMLAAVLAYPTLLLLAWAALRSRLDRLPAATALAIFGLMPKLVYQATTAYADVHLLLFLLGALVFLDRWLRERARADLWLAGVSLAGAIGTKNEGLTFAVLTTVAVCVALRRWRPLLALGGAVAVNVPFLAWRAVVPPTVEGYAGRLSLSLIAERLPRLPAIAVSFAKQFGTLPNWGVYWYLLVLAAICGATAWRRPRAWWLWATLLGQLGVYALAYVVSPWDLAPHLATSLDRLVLHLTAPALLLLALHWEGTTQRS